MKREHVDLRKEQAEVNVPPITLTTSLVIAVLLCTAGIAFALIGNWAGGNDGSGDGDMRADPRPYLLLSSTIDLVQSEDNVTYEDLQIHLLIGLVLAGDVILDLNLTAEMQSRASFLYPDANDIALTAVTDGIPETVIFGTTGTGENDMSTAILPFSGGLLTVTILTWGSGP